MANIRKRGRYQWQVRVRRKGYPDQVKTFNTKADADAWARTIEAEMDRGVFTPRAEAERTSLAECLERYGREITPAKKGATKERTLIGRWLAHPLASRPMATIRGSDMATYRDERLALGKSPITVNNELILISHLFNVARKEWGMESLLNPVSMIRRPKIPRGRDRRLLPVEEQRLQEAASPELRVIIILAIETAMRQGEIAQLRRTDIDLKNRVARLRDTKNGEERLVPLSTPAIEAINSLPPRISGALFSLQAGAIAKAFSRLCRRVEIDGLRFHDLRHEATSRLFEKGFNPMEVSAITGHKGLNMLKRYTHLRAEDLAKRLG